MIKRTRIKTGRSTLVKTYSDQGYYIRKEGSDFLYDAAVDVVGMGFKYVETDILIPVKDKETSTEEITKEE